MCIVLQLLSAILAESGPASLRGNASSAPTYGQPTYGQPGIPHGEGCRELGTLGDEIVVKLEDLQDAVMPPGMTGGINILEDEEEPEEEEEEPENFTATSAAAEEEGEEMEEEADEMEEQEEENDAPSEYALLEGWWSNWHGAMAQNHSKHTVKICPQGTFIKTMQMVTSSKLNQSLLRIQNTRCSPVAMQESRIGHNPHFGHHPGHFHRRRFYHRRRPHFHRRRFHHSRRRFHHHSRRRFHHHSRRRFHHSRRRFHRSHRNFNAGNFREATIFSNASVDGLCFGGKCAGYSGPAHRVTCGHQSRLAGYALRVDCKIRSIRFFCRHLGQ